MSRPIIRKQEDQLKTSRPIMGEQIDNEQIGRSAESKQAGMSIQSRRMGEGPAGIKADGWEEG